MHSVTDAHIHTRQHTHIARTGNLALLCRIVSKIWCCVKYDGLQGDYFRGNSGRRKMKKWKCRRNVYRKRRKEHWWQY